MQTHQQQFIDLALEYQALCFGEYTLKSGRISPYFFNAGLFNRGNALAQLGRCYAAAIVQSGVEFDVLFGPAYKGIPLVATTAIALADEYQRDVPYAYNRKERKDHGEGGQLVGADLRGRILIIDDVITAGTAVREVIELIEAVDAQVAGVVVGLNRQERGNEGLSAIQELERDCAMPVISIIDLEHIVEYLRQEGRSDELVKIEAYRAEYGTEIGQR